MGNEITGMIVLKNQNDFKGLNKILKLYNQITGKRRVIYNKD